MKMILIILFALFSFQLSAQQVNTNKSAIQSILQANYHCVISIGEITTWLNPSIRTWGFMPGTYEPNYLKINERCVAISYSVEKDSNGSSYKRLLLIPVSLIEKKRFNDGDEVYYEDSWAGKGPRFDTQGGKYKANNMIRKILDNIKYDSQ